MKNKIFFFCFMLLAFSSLESKEYVYGNTGEIIGVKFSNNVEVGYKYDSSSNITEITNAPQTDESTLITEVSPSSTPATTTTNVNIKSGGGALSWLFICIIALLASGVRYFTKRG